MALIDTYRRSVARKQDEIARLTEQKAREYAKMTGFNNKIQTATRQMNSSKSTTTINSRLKEVHKNQENIAKVEKKIAEFETKISKKNKELQAEQRKLGNEELKEAKKLEQQQINFQRDQAKAFSAVNRTLTEHSDAISS